MKKIIALLLLLVFSLSAICVPTVFAEAEPTYVEVAQGKNTGGKQYNPGTGVWEGLMYPASSLIDSTEDTFAGFYVSRFQGYMYIDLGCAYEIDRVEVLAYNTYSHTRCGDYNIVAGNTEPDTNAYDAENTIGEILVASVPMDTNANSAAVGYKTFTMPEGESYQYISFEKLQENSDGLLINDVKIYVREDKMPEDLPETLATNVALGKTEADWTMLRGALHGSYCNLNKLTDGADPAIFGDSIAAPRPASLVLDLGKYYDLEKIVLGVGHNASTQSASMGITVSAGNTAVTNETELAAAAKTTVLTTGTSALTELKKTEEVATPVIARYIYIQVASKANAGAGAGDYAWISEIEVWGVEAEPTEPGPDTPTPTPDVSNPDDYQNVAVGKATGGKLYNPDNRRWDDLMYPADKLVDGQEDAYAGFYYSRFRGYMYIDLGQAYKIDHIDVLSYNNISPSRAGEYNIVAGNSLPDNVAYDAENTNGEILVAAVPKDVSATSAAVGYKTFTMPENSGEYRYISLEKLQENSDGLLVYEVRVHVLKEDMPVETFSNMTYGYENNTLSLTAEAVNSEADSLTFMLKAYDATGATQGVMAQEVLLNDDAFSAEIDLSALALSENTKVDLVAVDSLTELNPVFMVQNVLTEERTILSLRTKPMADFSAEAVQKGVNAEISGTASGSVMLATVFNPGKVPASLTAENIDDYVATFECVALDATDGSFTKAVLMPAKATSGTYTAVFGLIAGEEPVANRTKTFAFTSIVDDFETVTADNFIDLVEEYEDSYTELLPLLTERSATIGESFIQAKESFATGALNEDVKELDSPAAIETVIRASILLDDTKNEEACADSIETYGDTMPKIFNEDYVDAEEFESLLGTVKEELPLSSAANIVEAYQTAAAMSAILNGSRAEIVWALENFADALGVDLEAVEDAGVSLNDVAKRISNTENAVNGYIENGMENTVTQAVKSAKAANSSSSSSSSRGSGRGGSSSVYVPVPQTTPEIITTPESSVEDTQTLASLYTDMAGYNWAIPAVNALSEKEILNGTGDGQFSPGQNMTREQVAKLIVLAFGFEGTAKANVFNDCNIDAWYYPYITAAGANGIVKGIDRTFFGVGHSITRQDIAVMLDRAMLIREVAAASTEHTEFKDAADIDNYAADSVNRLASMGIIAGMEDGSFCPKELVTRAQAAVMLNRILELM